TSWVELVASLGLPGLRRHDLRHAGATWFANAGIPIHVVSDILVHASVETTRAYLHTDNTALQNAGARMNEHLREAAMSSEKRLNPLTMSSQGVQRVQSWVQDRREHRSHDLMKIPSDRVFSLRSG